MKKPPAKKTNTKNPVEVTDHDSTQIEVKTVHRIPDGVPLSGTISYVQDIFFFMPKSLGLRTDSYSKDTFYRSLINYIRIKTPSVLGDEERHTGQIDKILPVLSSAAANKNVPENLNVAIDEVRLFGAYFNDQLKILTRHTAAVEVPSFLEDLQSLLRSYRIVMDRCIDFLDPQNHKSLIDAFRYIDEFLSNRLEECILVLCAKQSNCAHVMKEEFRRRQKMNYLTVVDPKTGVVNDEQKREQFVFRMGRFKKYISELLYLEVKRERHDRIFTNIAAAFGAAAAAFLNALADPNLRTSISGSFFVSMRDSIPLMLTVVVTIYVFKDRMKETVRESLLSRLRPWVPDYSFKIRNKQGDVLGLCKEEAHFQGTMDLDPAVRMVRQDKTEIILPSDTFEDVIFYRRRLKLKKEKLENMFRNTDSLKDIIRFDFNPFLAKMSNAVRDDEFYCQNGDVAKVSLPKVYHVNLVVRHQISTKQSGQHKAYYTRVRLILDRNGIKRIEIVDITDSLNMVEKIHLDQMDEAA